MTFEKTIIQANGNKVNIRVDMFFDSYGSVKMHYVVSVTLCAKGKRTFTKPIDTDSYLHRSLSMPERAASVKSQIITLIGVDEYNNAILDAWNSLKPNLLTTP